jgi:Response regulator containing CheY-like receiver, AAA-type ATPase, and DNA-binding domains
MPTILVVEDDVAIRTLLAAILLRDGHTVVECGNGIEALRAHENRRFDAVILDLMLPLLSGREVLDLLAASQRRRNVVVLTASNPAHFPTLNHSCISSILRKPFDLEELRKSVAAAVTQHVLLVEDNPADAYLIERQLTVAGYKVQWTSNGALALAELRDHRFDAAVVDLLLPVVSGFDVLNAIAESPDPPATVVLTMLEELRSPLRADQVLRKPEGISEVVPALRNLIL